MDLRKRFSLFSGPENKPLYYNVGISFALIFILLTVFAGEWINALLLVGLILGFVIGNVVHQLGYLRLSVHLGVVTMAVYQSLVLYFYRHDPNLGVIWFIAGPVLIARFGEPRDILVWTPVYVLAIVIGFSYVEQYPIMQHPLSLANLIGLLCLNSYISYRFIVERKEREAKLLEAAHESELAERRATRLLATLSHELRSPMSSILLAAEMLKDSTEDEKTIEHLHRSATLTTKVLNDVLELAKVEAQLSELTRDSFQLFDLLSEINASLEPQAAANGTKLLLLIPPDCPAEWYSSVSIIRQVLNNLLSNAIKHTLDGEVLLDVKVHEDYLEFLVIDTGSGIPAEHQKEIFEPFITFAENSPEGTGLGLTLASDYAQRLGCSLSLVDSKPGVGTTFCFKVPSKEYRSSTFADCFKLDQPLTEPVQLKPINQPHENWLSAWCQALECAYR